MSDEMLILLTPSVTACPISSSGLFEPPCRTMGSGAAFLISRRRSSLSSGVEVRGVDPVARPDGHGQAVDAGLGDEAGGLLGLGVDDVVGAALGVPVGLADGAELALDGQPDGVRGLDHLLGDRDVLLEGQEGLVDHDAGEPGLDGGEDLLVGRAVVEVHGHRDRRPAGPGEDRGQEVGADVAELVGVDRDDERGALLLADLHDPLEHRPVADVEGGHGEVVPVGDVQQVAAVEQHGWISFFSGWAASWLAALALHGA